MIWKEENLVRLIAVNGKSEVKVIEIWDFKGNFEAKIVWEFVSEAKSIISCLEVDGELIFGDCWGKVHFGGSYFVKVHHDERISALIEYK